MCTKMITKIKLSIYIHNYIIIRGVQMFTQCSVSKLCLTAGWFNLYLNKMTIPQNSSLSSVKQVGHHA